jgi:hypothetical protein
LNATNYSVAALYERTLSVIKYYYDVAFGLWPLVLNFAPLVFFARDFAVLHVSVPLWLIIDVAESA